MINTKIKNALQSFYLIPTIFFFAVLGRIFDVTQITLPIIALAIILILIFCDDVKNVFGIIFYAPFYIKDTVNHLAVVLFVIVIAVVIVALLVYAVCKIIALKKQKALIKGKLYLPLILITIAYLLGGVGFDFNLKTAIVIVAFSLATFVFYFIALNCVKNTDKFFYKLFVAGAILVSFMVLYENYVNSGSIKHLFDRSYDTWVGAENVNVASTFILLGIFGAFGLGYKTAKDGLLLVVASIFYFFIIVTYCRMNTALGALSILVYVVLSFKHSPNKRKFLIFSGSIFLVVIVATVISWSLIEQMLWGFSIKEGLTGREELWPWCIEMFKQNPLFGIGFKIDGTVPCMGAGASNYVLAHNTLIQWITSLGIFGTLCMLVFTVFKYKILIKDFFGNGLMLRLLIVFVALSGITDQAPQMDPFIYNIVIVVMALIESTAFYNKKNKEEENEKNRLEVSN